MIKVGDWVLWYPNESDAPVVERADVWMIDSWRSGMLDLVLATVRDAFEKTVSIPDYNHNDGATRLIYSDYAWHAVFDNNGYCVFIDVWSDLCRVEDAWLGYIDLADLPLRAAWDHMPDLVKKALENK